ncbi:hypothetical protein KCV07_g338, partial [Aureobasidium melanogenum]
MGFFTLPDFSITIGPSPKKATKSNPQFLDEISKQPTDNCWKYYGKNTWMRRCKDPKTDRPFWMFGVTRDNDAEPTTNNFTCNIKPRKQPCDLDHLQDILYDIVWELARHREESKCHCDIEWMIRRQTQQKTLRTCAGTSPAMKSIWELMNQHDRLCSCGCFRQSKDEQSLELIQKQ